ncbi:MAG: hypothetical protein WDN08_10530 [Rhizomicrobium sp.]
MALAELATPLNVAVHQTQSEALHHSLLLGMVGVLFAACLSLILYFLTQGKLTFEAFLVGPECAIAAAGLSFHRAMDYIDLNGNRGLAVVFGVEAVFYLGLVLFSVVAYLIAHDRRILALNFRPEAELPRKDARGRLRILVNAGYTILSWIRVLRTRARLASYLMVNLSLGGLPMFLSATAMFPAGHS